MSPVRSTHRLHALLTQVEAALIDHGDKAELARVIEREAGITFQAAKNRLSRILGRSIVPNGEDTLLLQEWLHERLGSTPPATKSTTRPAARKRGYS